MATRRPPWRRDGLAWLGAATETEPHPQSLHQCRAVVYRTTRRLAVLPISAANLFALVAGQWVLDLRRAHRSRSAWPTAPCPQNYAPAASGNGRRAPR